MNQDPTNQVTGVARQATAREFLAVLFRRKWLIIGLFAVTTTTVLVLSLTTPTVYESAGRVLVKRGEKESVLSSSRQVPSQWEEELASEMEIVKSQPVLDRARQVVAAQPGIPAKLDPRKVHCEVMGKSNVVAIAYTDRVPEVAKRCAQAVMDAYVEYRQNDMSLSYPGRFFSSEIAEADAELRRLNEERRTYSNENGVIDLNVQRASELNLLQNFMNTRSQTAAELAEAQSEQRTMRELQTRPGIDNPTSPMGPVGEDPLLEIKRRIVDQEARVAERRERYRDDAIEVAQAESTLSTLQAMLRREVEARLEINQTRVTALEDRLRSVDADIARVRADLDAMPDKEARLAELDLRIDALKRRYGDLVEKSGTARIMESTTEPIKVMVLDPASPPEPQNTRDYVRIALAPAFSIVVGIGLAFFIDGLDITVRTAGHAEEVVELPVLATVNERRRRPA